MSTKQSYPTFTWIPACCKILDSLHSSQVLTPQYNSNLSRTNDVFNHSNNHFWQYMQPGYDALDFISCTGTNFLVRANAYQVP